MSILALEVEDILHDGPPDVALEPQSGWTRRRKVPRTAQSDQHLLHGLFQRTNYQDFARYNETDMAIAGDAEADAWPAADLKRARSWWTGDRKAALQQRGARLAETYKTESRSGPHPGCHRLGYQPASPRPAFQRNCGPAQRPPRRRGRIPRLPARATDILIRLSKFHSASAKRPKN